MGKTLKERVFSCGTCGYKKNALRWNYEPWNRDPVPTCPDGHGEMDPHYDVVGRAANVIQDSIPGGELIEHGICHPDGTPRRFDSKSDIRRAARAAGWTRAGDTPKLPGDRWI